MQQDVADLSSALQEYLQGLCSVEDALREGPAATEALEVCSTQPCHTLLLRTALFKCPAPMGTL